MTTNAVWLKIEPERVAPSLQEALEKLDPSASEVVLDFTSVKRIDASAIQALEALARTSGDKGVKVVLCGVGVDVYKVLKLMNVALRFSFR